MKSGVCYLSDCISFGDFISWVFGWVLVSDRMFLEI